MAKGWMIGGAAFIGVLLLASIVVALLDNEEVLPEGTPEATVQQFFRATQEEDYQAAYALIGSDLSDECSLDEFVGQNSGRFARSEDSRIVLDDTNMVNEDVAVVNVSITQFYGSGPFGSNESTFSQSFTLRQEDNAWKFSQYPWPYYGCPTPRQPVPAIIVEPTATSTPEPEPDGESDENGPVAP